MMGLGSIIIAERKTEQHGAPAYLYNFGYKNENKIAGTDYAMGTPHAMDISFKFYNEQPQKDGTPGKSYWGGSRPERFIASHNMAELWSIFARTGKPAAKGVPDWPAYNLKDRSTMRIDTKCTVINDRYAEELKCGERSAGCKRFKAEFFALKLQRTKREAYLYGHHALWVKVI